MTLKEIIEREIASHRHTAWMLNSIPAPEAEGYHLYAEKLLKTILAEYESQEGEDNG